MLKLKRRSKELYEVDVDGIQGRIEKFKEGWKYTVFMFGKEITGWETSKGKCLKEIIKIVRGEY